MKVSGSKSGLDTMLVGMGFVREHRFCEFRRWRFDWALPNKKIAVEYDGLFSVRSRHTTPTGFTNDCTKMNAATFYGWRVIRLTAIHTKEMGKVFDLVAAMTEGNDEKGRDIFAIKKRKSAR